MRNITTITRTVLLLVITIFMVIAYHGEAIACPQVNMYLAQCLPYLKAGGTPPAMCCNGLNSLKAAAPAKSDRQVACNCLKSVANTIPGINDDYAKQLPAKCGVNLGVPFSKTVDCNSIN
ncbi:PREDICTED: non-specific lipid-transfer protein 11-like [Camelina sativa]|uniref:Non-specific lipid-transfer protein n=1 Tax=Camelina sativa TaxID=90675 RepID=A0ABM0U953_CAMSA|nr:PREDICTED: non-specific lipid-transfer protein 11-like [Camelina sativa]